MVFRRISDCCCDVAGFTTRDDVLSRPVSRNSDTFAYGVRGEVTDASIDGNGEGHEYDNIGNSVWSSFNAETNLYAANALNQYVSVTSDEATVEPVYDADGNLTNDMRFAYAYDAENRMISVRPIAPVEGDLAVVNAYDHRHRRIMKRVERFDSDAWQTAETHAFVYDGCNIVLERIAFADGSTRTIEYFWGNDLSGTEQGAGNAPVAKRSGCLSEANPQGRKGPRVGGLLTVSVDGQYFFPCYDQNGNVVCYVSESGTIAAQYVYDPYGNVIEQYGTLADRFAIRFSTKYADIETGLISYLYRFYHTVRGCWLNRDPIEERGGVNLYAFCGNAPNARYDISGCRHMGPWTYECSWNEGTHTVDVFVSYFVELRNRSCCSEVQIFRYVKKFLGIWGGTFGEYVLDDTQPKISAPKNASERWLPQAEGDSPEGMGRPYHYPWSQDFKWVAKCCTGAKKGKVLSVLYARYFTSGHFEGGVYHGEFSNVSVENY